MERHGIFPTPMFQVMNNRINENKIDNKSRLRKFTFGFCGIEFTPLTLDLSIRILDELNIHFFLNFIKCCPKGRLVLSPLVRLLARNILSVNGMPHSGALHH